MSPAVALREVGQAVYDELVPSLQPDDADHDYTLAGFVDATTSTIDDVWEVATTGPPLSILFDPERCPVWGLRYCAGAYGVVLPEVASFASMTEWEARSRFLIADRPARRRGTRKAILSAVRELFAPGVYVDIARRTDPDSLGDDAPYDVTIFTRNEPLLAPGPTLEEAVLAAAEPHRPRGHVFHYRELSGTTWRDLELAGVTWKRLADEGVTWDDLQTGAWTP